MTGNNTFMVSNSQIFPVKAIPGIKITSCKGEVVNSTFKSNATLGNTDQTNSGLLISGLTSDVTVNNCTFISLTSNMGAGISATSASKISISKSFFFDNTAPIGGGVSLVEVSTALLATNNFTANKAVKIDGSPINMVQD